MNKQLHVKYRHLPYTRITVAKDRVSVKIGIDCPETMRTMITYKCGEFIKGLGEVDKTFRGTFYPQYNNMTFYNSSKKEKKTVRIKSYPQPF